MGEVTDLYEAIFAASPDAMLVADSEMRLVAVNPAGIELFGLPQTKLLGRRISEFSVPEDAPSATFARFLETGTMTGKYHIVRPGGDVRLVEYVATSNILPGYHLSVLREVTSATPDVESHRERERTKLAMAAGKMGTWEWEVGAGRLKWSEELELLHGLGPGEFDGTFASALALVHPLDRDVVVQAGRTLRREGRMSTQFRVVRRDGQVRWLSVHGQLFNEGSTRTSPLAVGVSVDVSEQKRQQDALALVVEASRALAASLDYEATLKSVAALAVPDLADWCSVYVLDEIRGLQLVALQHRDPKRIEWARGLLERYPPDPDAEGGVPGVIRTGTSLLLSHIPEELFVGLNDEQMAIVRELDLTSYMVVPMTTHDRIFGAMAFASTEARRHYDQPDLALAEHLARRAGLAVENALAHQEIEREKAKLESIVASVTYGVIHLDRKGRITYANPSGASLLESAVAELEGGIL